MTPNRQSDATKQLFHRLLSSSYFLPAIFWVANPLGSLVVGERGGESASLLFLGLVITWISTGIWEILTGWYADKFTRRTSILAGFIVCAAAWLCMAIALTAPEHSRQIWLVGLALWTLGPALQSGSIEAWFTDRMNYLAVEEPNRRTEEFQKGARLGVLWAAAGSTLAIACFVGATLLWSGMPGIKAGLAACCALGFVATFAVYAGTASQIREEYSADPAYQTDESIYAFLKTCMLQFRFPPLRRVATTFIGVSILRYTFFGTLWAYALSLVADGQIARFPEFEVTLKLLGLVVVQFLGGSTSPLFGQALERIRSNPLRTTLEFGVHAGPFLLVLPLSQLNPSPNQQLVHLGLALFCFRISSPRILGSLQGDVEYLLKQSESRASALSLLSGIAAFVTAVIMAIIYSETLISTPPANVLRLLQQSLSLSALIAAILVLLTKR